MMAPLQEMVTLEETSQGIVVPVKAQAGARRNGITGEIAGSLKVSVTQAPEKGKANDAIVEVLADQLKLRRSQIELIVGQTVPRKKFLVTGICRSDLEARIAVILAGCT